MVHAAFVPHTAHREYSVEDMKRRASDFYADIRRRRTVREFADRPVPREIIEDCLRAAGKGAGDYKEVTGGDCHVRVDEHASEADRPSLSADDAFRPCGPVVFSVHSRRLFARIGQRLHYCAAGSEGADSGRTLGLVPGLLDSLQHQGVGPVQGVLRRRDRI